MYTSVYITIRIMNQCIALFPVHIWDWDKLVYLLISAVMAGWLLIFTFRFIQNGLCTIDVDAVLLYMG